MHSVFNAPVLHYMSLPHAVHVQSTHMTSTSNAVDPAHMQLNLLDAANRWAAAAGGRHQRTSPRTWCPPGSTSWHCLCLQRHCWPKRRSRRCRWACCCPLHSPACLGTADLRGLASPGGCASYHIHPIRLAGGHVGDFDTSLQSSVCCFTTCSP